VARDTKGVLRKLMMETVDGEYQNYKAFGGAYTREHFFGKYPETAALVANCQRRRHLASQSRRPRSAQGLRRLPRGVNALKGSPP
jgi:pyruvate dehydrogenase complex dehydrogenase (E1) component